MWWMQFYLFLIQYLNQPTSKIPNFLVRESNSPLLQIKNPTAGHDHELVETILEPYNQIF
jgi:hypothetical protein